MNETSKPNDMFLAMVNKPDATLLDLLKNDINLSNTQLLSREEYKETPLVKKLFTKDGTFDESTFNKVYDMAQYQFLALDEKDLMTNLVDLIEYNRTSFFRPLNGKVADNSYTPYTNKNNPLHQATGLEGLNYTSEPEISAKEAALQGNIWDPINQKWLNETAESRNIFEKAFGQSLMYAKYTKDGWQENPVTKEAGYHQKGEYITDQNGNYFTQLAGSEDLINGAEIVKLQDILTKEGSVLNHIDFFDSDGLDKSIAGVALKTLVSTGIYFVPYVGQAYTAASILVGLGANLPQLYKSVAGLFGDKVTQVSPTANKLINYFSKFDKSMSDYGSQHFWSLENIGNLVSDIIGLLYQQGGMAYLSKYIKPVSQLAIKDMASYATLHKEVQDRAKIAKALSLGYMAVTLASLTYNDALEGGYDQRTAGIATLLTTAALFGIMNFNEGMNGLGTWFLDKTTGYDKDFLRAPIDKLAKTTTRNVALTIELHLPDLTKGQKVKAKLLQFANKADDYLRLGGEGMWKGFINEGVEEVSEEVIQDSIKGLIDGLTYLGFQQGWYDGEGSFGGWSNVFSKEGLERYLQTFVGGALGGALFDFHLSKVKPFIDSFNSNAPAAVKLADLDMIDIVLRGLTNEFMKAVDTASKFISNRQTAIKDSNGKYTIAKDGDTTLRDIVTLETKNRMRTIDALVKQVLQGADFSTLPADFRDAVANIYAPTLRNAKVVDFIEKRFLKSVEDVVMRIKDVNTIQQLIDAESTTPELKKDLLDQLKAINEDINEKLKYVHKFFSGAAHVDNFTQSLFLMNPKLREYLQAGMNEEEFYENVLREGSNVSYANLEKDAPNSKMSKRKVHDLYTLFMYSENNLDTLVDTLPLLQKTFDNISDLISPSLAAFSQNIQHLTVIRNAINKMKLDYDTRVEAIKSWNYNQILKELMGDKWDEMTVADKAKAISDKQTEDLRNLLKEYSIDHLVDLIKNDPKAFSNTERYLVDYASELLKKGVINVDETAYDDKQLDILKLMINVEFVNTPLSKFNLQAVRQIIANVNAKLGDDTNSFRNAIINLKTEAQKDSNALIDVKLGLINLNEDSWTDDIEFFKIKTLEEYLGDGEVIFKDLYDNVLAGKRLLDVINNEKVKNVLLKFVQDSDLNSQAITALNVGNLENATAQQLFIELNSQHIEDGLYTEEEWAALLQKLENITGNSDIIASLNSASSFEKKYSSATKVTNPFKDAVTKVFFSLGGSNANVVDFITQKVAEIVKGEGESSNIAISDELMKDLDHVGETLRTILAVANMMAPVVDIEGGKETYGINRLRKEFADSMGVDSSKMATITSEEYDLFSTVLGEVNRQIAVLSNIYQNMTEDLNRLFEQIRQQMVQNSYMLHRYHCDVDTTDEDIFHIDDIFTDETPATIEEQLKLLLEYRLKLHLKIRSLLQNEDFVKERLNRKDGETAEQAFIRYLVDKAKSNKEDLSLFYYDEPDIKENDASIDEDRINTYTQYWLNEVVSLVGTNADPKKINQAIVNTFLELNNLYPRLDLIKAAELAVIGSLNKEVFDYYGEELGKAYDENEKAAVKQYVHGLIRIPGPAGSGKTTLYSIILSSLEKLGINPNTIAVTAKAERKVKDLTEDLDHIVDPSRVMTLDKLISGTANLAAKYEEMQTNAFTAIADKWSEIRTYDTFEVSDNIKITKKDGLYKATVTSPEMTVIFDLAVNNEGLSIADIKSHITFNDASKISLTDGTKIVLLDECTNLNPAEWAILDYLGSNGITVIATGDNLQRGYTINYTNSKSQPTKVTIGDENVLGFNVPALASVHRAHNSAVKYNETQLRLISEKVLDSLETHLGARDYAYGDTLSKAILLALKETVLQYALTENGFLGGKIINQELDFINTLSGIKKTDSILGIVATPEQVGELQNLLEKQGFTNISVLTSDLIQGAEADYAIAYKLNPEGSTVKNYKELYTVITRGRKGFIGFNSKLLAVSGITSKDVGQAHLITRNRLDTDSGNQWLESWNKNTEALADETPADGPTKKVTPTEDEGKEQVTPEEIEKALEETPAEIDSEEGVVPQATTIQTILGEEKPFAMIHQLGYLPGLTAQLMKDIEDKKVNEIELDKLPLNSSLYAVLLLLRSNGVTLQNSIYGNSLFLDIKEGALKQDSVKKAYIYVVNALTEKVTSGQIKKFLVEPVTDVDYYLKPNDDPSKTAKNAVALSIPITTDGLGNADKRVILGVLGRSTDVNGNSTIKNSVIENLKNPILLEVNENVDHSNGLKAAYNNRIPNRVNSHSAIFPFTGMRPFKINSELESNKMKVDALNNANNAALLALGRWELNSWMAMGWEYVHGQDGRTILFDLNDELITRDKLKAFYDKYRFLPLSQEGLDSLWKLAGHEGVLYVIKPIGADDSLALPVLIKTATTWNDWYRNATEFTKEKHLEHMITYKAKVMLTALAHYYKVPIGMPDLVWGNILDLHSSPVNNIGVTVNGNTSDIKYGFNENVENKFNKLIDAINADNLTSEEKTKLLRGLDTLKCQVLRGAVDEKLPTNDVKSQVTTILDGNRYLNTDNTVKPLVEFLEAKVPLWAYESKLSVATVNFVERAYERPNLVFDLSAVHPANLALLKLKTEIEGEPPKVTTSITVNLTENSDIYTSFNNILTSLASMRDIRDNDTFKISLLQTNNQSDLDLLRDWLQQNAEIQTILDDSLLTDENFGELQAILNTLFTNNGYLAAANKIMEIAC